LFILAKQELWVPTLIIARGLCKFVCVVHVVVVLSQQTTLAHCASVCLLLCAICSDKMQCLEYRYLENRIVSVVENKTEVPMARQLVRACFVREFDARAACESD
jgi:hypothetical protein